MISTTRSLLKSRHAAKFRAPDDQCVFKQASLLQVGDQGRGWLVQDRTVFRLLLFKDLVSIPVADTFTSRLVSPVE